MRPVLNILQMFSLTIFVTTLQIICLVSQPVSDGTEILSQLSDSKAHSEIVDNLNFQS